MLLWSGNSGRGLEMDQRRAKAVISIHSGCQQGSTSKGWGYSSIVAVRTLGHHQPFHAQLRVAASTHIQPPTRVIIPYGVGVCSGANLSGEDGEIIPQLWALCSAPTTVDVRTKNNPSTRNRRYFRELILLRYYHHNIILLHDTSPPTYNYRYQRPRSESQADIHA